MRVTTAGQTQATISRLLSSQSKLAEAQERATSGLKVARMSDDPTSANTIVRDGGALRGITQYTRNAEGISASLDAADSALQQLTDIMSRAKELGVGANSSSASPSARNTSAVELRQLLKQAVAVGNTKVGNEFLFGGISNDGRPPFDESQADFVPVDPPAPGAPTGTPGTPRFPSGERVIEAGASGQRLAGPPDGTTVLLGHTAGAPDASVGVLPALQKLIASLEAPDAAGIPDALTGIDAAFGGLQTAVGQVGARQNQVDSVKAGLSALGTTLTAQKSSLGEIDAERAITEMLARQTAYQSAMLAASKVMGLSLTDYLR